MNLSRRNNRFFAALATALVIVAAACGGSESSSDDERDRNISGGVQASQEAHPAPYQVALYMQHPDREFQQNGRDFYDFQDPNNWVFNCSGVIISARWIAVAGRCLDLGGKPWRNDRFHFGVGKVHPADPVTDRYWDEAAYRYQYPYVFGTVGMVSAGTYLNYALVKTDRPIPFFEFANVRPIDLPFGLDDNWPATGTTGQISGFGAKAAGVAAITKLRTALVEVLEQTSVDYATTCGEWTGYIADSRLCLGKANDPRGGLACDFDWGGPVVVNVDNKPMLAGVISEVDRLGNCSDGGATLAVRGTTIARWAAGGAINDFVATPDDQSVTLSWSKPYAGWFTYAEDEAWDPAPFDYVVEMSEDGGTSWNTVADGENTETTVTLSGLENGKGYAFRVAALNEIVAERSDYRYYSSVAKVVVGAAEKPVAMPDIPALAPETMPESVPTLAGQAPQGAGDFAAMPTVASATPTTVPGGSAPATTPTTNTVAAGGSTTISVASAELSTFNPIAATDVAKLAKASVPTRARVAVTVDKASKKVCAVKGTTVVALAVGKCKVKVAVATGKGKPKSKTTTLTVKK